MKMKAFLVLAIALIAITPAVIAQLGVPHQFYGKALIDGQKAPDNLFVTAEIGGTQVAATTVSNGTYGYSPDIFYIQDPDEDRNGKTISFYIEGEKAAEHQFRNGYSTRLDLTTDAVCGDGICAGSESCSDCSDDCGSCGNDGSDDDGDSGSSGSSGSSGGGGGFVTTTSDDIVNETANETMTNETTTNGTTEGDGSAESASSMDLSGSDTETETCTPDWRCSAWLDCVNGIQKRTCIDRNECGLTMTRPETSRECNVSRNQLTSPGGDIITDEGAKRSNPITALVPGIGGSGNPFVASIILLIVVPGAYYSYRHFKK